jgi:hypothetical protein
MPTVYDFKTFKLTMYAEDHNPPHVHLVSKEHEAMLAIRDGSILAGKAPSKFVKAAQAYIATHRANLLARWADLKGER